MQDFLEEKDLGLEQTFYDFERCMLRTVLAS